MGIEKIIIEPMFHKREDEWRWRNDELKKKYKLEYLYDLTPGPQEMDAKNTLRANVLHDAYAYGDRQFKDFLHKIDNYDHPNCNYWTFKFTLKSNASGGS
ncbi:hypothetical protein RUM44_005796 [Polyplax serrata]|uniref:Uncharacterized protein n=1 Tax=Polyplax serrata TaxID=468196 RepID=A0ABR1AY35_POLSC